MSAHTGCFFDPISDVPLGPFSYMDSMGTMTPPQYYRAVTMTYEELLQSRGLGGLLGRASENTRNQEQARIFGGPNRTRQGEQQRRGWKPENCDLEINQRRSANLRPERHEIQTEYVKPMGSDKSTSGRASQWSPLLEEHRAETFWGVKNGGKRPRESSPPPIQQRWSSLRSRILGDLFPADEIPGDHKVAPDHDLDINRPLKIARTNERASSPEGPHEKRSMRTSSPQIPVLGIFSPTPELSESELDYPFQSARDRERASSMERSHGSSSIPNRASSSKTPHVGFAYPTKWRFDSPDHEGSLNVDTLSPPRSTIPTAPSPGLSQTTKQLHGSFQNSYIEREGFHTPISTPPLQNAELMRNPAKAKRTLETPGIDQTERGKVVSSSPMSTQYFSPLTRPFALGNAVIEPLGYSPSRGPLYRFDFITPHKPVSSFRLQDLLNPAPTPLESPFHSRTRTGGERVQYQRNNEYESDFGSLFGDEVLTMDDDAVSVASSVAVSVASSVTIQHEWMVPDSVEEVKDEVDYEGDDESNEDAESNGYDESEEGDIEEEDEYGVSDVEDASDDLRAAKGRKLNKEDCNEVE
jgi:hypothetical protein